MHLAITPEGEPITGLKVCTAHCEPITGAPCGDTLNCVYEMGLTEFDCFSSKRFKKGVTCDLSSDCDTGLVCAKRSSETERTCKVWCAPANGKANDGCTGIGQVCIPFEASAKYNGVEYGICAP